MRSGSLGQHCLKLSRFGEKTRLCVVGGRVWLGRRMRKPRKTQPAGEARQAEGSTLGSATKPWHAVRPLGSASGRFVELGQPQFVPGNVARHEAALAALVELLTARVEKSATIGARAAQGLDFLRQSRCPRPSGPAPKENCR